MQVPVHFYSFFKDLTGCASTRIELPPGCTVEDLLAEVHRCFPKLQPMHKSTLVAVGLEYQDRSYVLRPGEEVSLFPPVQGG